MRGGSAREGHLFEALGIRKAVGVLQVKVYRRVGKSVIWDCKRAKKD